MCKINLESGKKQVDTLGWHGISTRTAEKILELGYSLYYNQDTGNYTLYDNYDNDLFNTADAHLIADIIAEV